MIWIINQFVFESGKLWFAGVAFDPTITKVQCR